MVVLEQLGETLLREMVATFPQRQVTGAWLYGSQARRPVIEAEGERWIA